jgi:DNA-binding winged helix-turn-helix (wHTH) protein/tetratricopeptide (TPR) repeat protein
VSARIPASRKGLYDFGPFRLDVARHLLLKEHKPVRLSPKAFEILFLLVERQGALVAKGELLESVWPDTFVEENNLTQYISTLRKVLGEGEGDGEYIQTVPKLGYRFVSPVRDAAPGQQELLVEKHTKTRIIVREEEEEFEQEALDAAMPGLASVRRPTRFPAPVQSMATAPAVDFWRRARWLAIPVVCVAVAGGFAWRHFSTSRPPSTLVPAPVKPRYSIAVLGFRNLSGNSADDWLSVALAEMLTTEIAAGGQLRAVPSEAVQSVRSDLKISDDSELAKPILAQLRNRAGADVLVTGSFVELGTEPGRQMRLDLHMWDAVTGETLFSTAITGRSSELFKLVSRSGDELRSRLGVPMLTDLEGAEDQAALPSTPEAARLYSEGLAKLRVSDAPAAEKLLTLAVTSDPKFSLGHSALASAWSALGYDEKARQESRRALDLSLNLSREQHLLIAGQYAELTRDWNQAVATYQELFHSFPDNVDYGLRLANAQTFAGKSSDALVTVAKLHTLPPPASGEPQIDLKEADAAAALGDFQRESEAASRAIENGKTLNERLLVAEAWTRKSWALRRLGKVQDADQGLAEAKRIFAETGDLHGLGSTLHLIAGEQSERGDYLEAVRSYDEAIRIFRQIGDRRSLAQSINGVAIVQYESGNLRKAEALYQQYYDIETEVGSRVNAAGALGNIANVADAQGNLAEALRLNQESLKVFNDVGDQRAAGTALGNIALLLYEEGDLAASAKTFDEAIEIKRQIGYQRGVAYDLAGLGQVYRAAGNLAAAQSAEEESLAIRNQIGEQHNAAASRLNLAILDLDFGRPDEAEKIASEASLQFREEKSKANEAAGEEIMARSFLAQGRMDEAQAAIKEARSLARGESNLPLGFDIAETAARIETAAKNPAQPSRANAARANLASSLSVARRCGYLEYQFKLSLAIGQIDLQSGHATEGRAILSALAKESASKGFSLIARRAAATLGES